MSEHLIDLDELVLSCKSQEARKYIAEAVICYKNGAYRACVVTTWIAVVYDFIYKLRQLALTGDKNAIDRLQEFENARTDKTHELALKFEKQILTWAKDDFEFLSPIQFADLNRLSEDRNRCAHPSMMSDEEIYQPPAELARYHLRNAITHLLQHPPVQGKAALKRLQSETESEYFPHDTSAAVEHFRHGPLANAKPVLVRNFTISLIKKLLLEEHENEAWSRFTSALNAIRQMYVDITTQAFQEQFSKTVQSLSDELLQNVIKLINAISDTWQFLDGDTRIRLENYVQAMKEDEIVEILPIALEVSTLKSFAERRIPDLNRNMLQQLVKNGPRPEYIERAIAIYSESSSYLSASDCAHNIIIPLVQHMTEKHAEQLLEHAETNNQISGDWNFPDVLMVLTQKDLVSLASFKSLCDKYKNWNEFYYLNFPDMGASE